MTKLVKIEILFVFCVYYTSTLHTHHSTDTMSLISINPSASGVRKPVNFVMAYDKSGSMGEAANANGEGIACLYSKNDLGVHSVEIVARSLGPEDTLEIITYDSVVSTLLQRTVMNDEGKTKAINAIKTVQPGGCTALWDGLKTALTAAKRTEETHGNTCVIMITDGVPSSSPSIGEVAALKQLRSTTENTCRVHTIGIGYGINSELLSNLADEGMHGGSFIFIPDGSMTITSWNNLLTNELCAADTKVPIVVNNAVVSVIGTLKYGQPYTYVANTPVVTNVTVDSKEQIAVNMQSIASCTSPEATNSIVTANAISVLKSIIRIAKADISSAKTLLQKFVQENIQHDIPIMQDILGQVAEGLTSEASRDKWGIHHLRSLVSAHTNQNCLNFKDPGPLVYTSPYIQAMSESIDIIANSILPPSPSLGATRQPVDSASFNSAFNNRGSSGCFGGKGKVLMNDGTLILIEDLKKGDIVYGGAKIMCVVVHANTETVNILDNLYITSWHPVRMYGKWVFPNSITNSGKLIMDKVYNYVLDSVHTIIVNGTIACTLAHGFTGDVIGHDFYGTEKVHNSLKNFPGYADGHVVVAEANVARNSTGLVCDYVYTV